LKVFSKEGLPDDEEKTHIDLPCCIQRHLLLCMPTPGNLLGNGGEDDIVLAIVCSRGDIGGECRVVMRRHWRGTDI
jgi:hypothetical protein